MLSSWGHAALDTLIKWPWVRGRLEGWVATFTLTDITMNNPLLAIPSYESEFSQWQGVREFQWACSTLTTCIPVTPTPHPGAVCHHCGDLTLPLPGLLHLDAAGGPEPLSDCPQPDCGQLLQCKQIYEEVHVPCGVRSPSCDRGHFCSIQASPLWHTHKVSANAHCPHLFYMAMTSHRPRQHFNFPRIW